MLPGWSSPLGACRTRESLPTGARTYVEFLERQLSVPIRWIGTGPGREEIIER